MSYRDYGARYCVKCRAVLCDVCNRHARDTAHRNSPRRFCSDACKQYAYRVRKGQRDYVAEHSERNGLECVTCRSARNEKT